MSLEIREDCREGTKPQGAVPRNGQMVLAVDLGGEADVTPGLAGDGIAEP
jgi:hypothetical protein